MPLSQLTLNDVDDVQPAFLMRIHDTTNLRFMRMDLLPVYKQLKGSGE
jgi:hypothetical protein